MVHGGPWGRDNWGYNPMAQWLANRGYACLQVNFRGSTGYGKTFLNAGNKQWGKAMHDDLIDAVQLGGRARATPTPRRSRSSAALTAATRRWPAATFTPDFFACAVDIVGPSNLRHADRVDPALLEADAAAVRRADGQRRRPEGRRADQGRLAAVPGRQDHSGRS